MAYKIFEQDLLASNKEVAESIRGRLQNNGISMVNIISSPGSGKTAFLEKTGPMLASQGIRYMVLTADCTTDRDAARLHKAGVPVIQINTGESCHINAQIIARALETLDLKGLDIIIIENVGNLICPSAFDLGEDAKIAFMSCAEGDDKPAKYPFVFLQAGFVILNKIDLLPYIDFDINRCEADIRQLNPSAEICRVSSKTGEGLKECAALFSRMLPVKKEEV